MKIINLYKSFILFIKKYYFLFIIKPYVNPYINEINSIKLNNEKIKKEKDKLLIHNEKIREKNEKLILINGNLEISISNLNKMNQILELKNKDFENKMIEYQKIFSEKTKRKNKSIKKKISLSGIQNENYGKGPIRNKENNLYFHGVSENENYSWNHRGLNHCFFEIKKDHKLDNPDKWDTYDASTFCSNCCIDEELSKNRRVKKVYRCNGHEI